jgi:hypothetical protein
MKPILPCLLLLPNYAEQTNWRRTCKPLELTSLVCLQTQQWGIRSHALEGVSAVTVVLWTMRYASALRTEYFGSEVTACTIALCAV